MRLNYKWKLLSKQDAQGHEGPALKEQTINLITDYYILFDGTRSLKLK